MSASDDAPTIEAHEASPLERAALWLEEHGADVHHAVDLLAFAASLFGARGAAVSVVLHEGVELAVDAAARVLEGPP